MISFRKANIDDLDLFYRWANDDLVRKYSFKTSSISYEEHTNWFKKTIADESTTIFVFTNEYNKAIGQVRIKKDENLLATIGISIDATERGKGYSSKILTMASLTFLTENPLFTIRAYIKKENINSIKAFESAGFVFSKTVIINEAESILLTTKK